MLKISEEKLQLAIELIKQNPDIDTKVLVDLIKVENDDSKKVKRKRVETVNSQKKWLDEEDEWLLSMKAMGMNTSSIADKLGRSNRAIQSRYRVLKAKKEK